MVSVLASQVVVKWWHQDLLHEGNSDEESDMLSEDEYGSDEAILVLSN